MNHGGRHILAQVRKCMEVSIFRVFLIIAPFVMGERDARQRHHVIDLHFHPPVATLLRQQSYVAAPVSSQNCGDILPVTPLLGWLRQVQTHHPP